jgi:hypothetical protein
MKEEMPLALANMFQINRSEAMQLAVFQILDNYGTMIPSLAMSLSMIPTA